MESHWRNLVDAIQSPVGLFRRLREKPAAVQGVVVAVVAQALFSLGPQEAAPMPGFEEVPTLGPVGDAVIGAIGFFIGIGAVHLVARWLGGRAGFPAALSALGLASTPLLLYAPLYVVAAITGLGGLAVLGMVALGLWSVVLDVLAVRETYGVSTGRAIAALLLSGFVIVLAVVVLFLIFGLLAVFIAL